MNPLQPIYAAIAKTITFFHEIFGGIFGETSGIAWTLSIVFLVVAIRLLLFPVFVKQIRSQRAMQELQPKIKALQAKHKGDRQTLNTELMKLYKEQGVNPLAGCLPLLIQGPIFLALYGVLRGLGPSIVNNQLDYPAKFGVPEDTARQLGEAKIFGAPIAAAFNSKPRMLDLLETTATNVKIVSVVLILAMTLTTYFTTRQMMAKNSAALDPQQQTQQRIMLYILPLLLALFGFSVPIGVLIYWTTSNLWSMGQQTWVIHRMPHATPAAAAADKAVPSSSASRNGKGAGKGADGKAGPGKGSDGKGGGRSERVVVDGGVRDATAGPRTPAPNTARPPSAKARKKSRSQRKGGRR